MAYHDHYKLSLTDCRPNELLSLHVPNTKRLQQLHLFVHCSMSCSSAVRKPFFNFPPTPPRERAALSVIENKYVNRTKKKKKHLTNERTYQVIKLCQLFWLASNAEKEWLISSLSSHVRRALQALLLVFISNILAFLSQTFTWKRHWGLEDGL